MSGPRPRHALLGPDAVGALHHWYVEWEVVVVIRDGERVRRVDLAAHEGPVDRWMEFVAQRRGWRQRVDGRGLAGAFVDAIDGVEAVSDGGRPL